METYNLVSFAGIFILIAFAWLCSKNRSQVNWKIVTYGLAIQIVFAVFIFILPIGTKTFLFINDVVIKVLDNANAGTRFLFGRLALGPGTTNAMGEKSLGFILAFQALPTIVFFASLMALLYRYGVMPWLIKKFSNLFTGFMKISGAESLCVASNIFVGVESSLVVKPYLDDMTESELCTILTAGMATVASSVMALYVFILHEKFPSIAGHLISASILSAPAAIIMSKLLLPETGTPVTAGVNVDLEYDKDENPIESIINGANSGVRLIVGISALLLAFLGLVELVNSIFIFFGNNINSILGLSIDWTLKGLLGYIFYPFTLIIGIPISDATEISKIIGERVIVTEVQSYLDLATILKAETLSSPRSAVIATYALCGFAHVASLAIFVGGFAALAPKRIKDLSQIGPRALFAATMACLMTAAVAGTFYSSVSILGT